MDRIDRITYIQMLRGMIEGMEKTEIPMLREFTSRWRLEGHPRIAGYFSTTVSLLEIEINRLQEQLDGHIDALARGE